MLSAYPARRPQDTSLKSAAWVDLLDPTDAERAAFEQAFGLRVPTAEELVEIETTSRLRNEHGTLYMTAPLLYAADDEPWVLVPTGFVLSEKILLTVRSSKLVAFHKVVQEAGKERADRTGAYFRAASGSARRPHGGRARKQRARSR